jgi:hypothetical protein
VNGASARVGERAHAAILLRVATKALHEARRAWKRADGSSDAAIVRSALRACVLAARTARRAGRAYVHDADAHARLVGEAGRLDAAVSSLEARLVLLS